MSKLELQQTCFEHIKSLCVNYRKDSSSRKTENYLNLRLASLENQWKDFEERHALLVLEIEDKTINYFSENVYENTKQLYLTTKKDMNNMLNAISKQTRGIKFDLSETNVDETHETEEGSAVVQGLLNKQECNFNAIHRAMSKIDVSRVTEKWELEENLVILKSKWEPVDKLHWEIDFQLKGSNSHYYETFSEIEEQYDELRKKLHSKIWSNAHYEKCAPKMELPEFSGNYCKWISFKDLFLETIHNNPTINQAQKMRHLKTKLKGEAESLVQHLSVSAENYHSCWEILTQRYDNRRLQFTSFFNTMMNLPVIQHPDSQNLKKLHDVIKECMNGMSNIGLDTSTWDPIIVQLMLSKLDSSTLNDYMNDIRDHREIQSLTDFLYFLECKFMAYETAKSTSKGNVPSERSTNASTTWKSSKHIPKKNIFDFKKSYNYHTSFGKCPHCSGNHVLMQCDKFLELDTSQRNNAVAKLKLCKNCLYSHNNNECKSNKTCKECNLRHHTLLHYSNKKFTPNRTNHVEQKPSTSTQHQISNHLSETNTEILLTTIQLKVKSMDGTYLTLRALLDQGSQVNLITENAVQLLRLPRRKLAATVNGIGSVSGDCRGQLNLSCQSIHSNFCFETQALIMKKLTNNLPHSTFEKCNWPHLENLKLADPEFNLSRPIDLLLGADVYSEIILDGVLKGNQQSLVAQQTQLGWILCGKLRTLNCHVTLINLEELTKFWETEEIQNSQDISKNDQCEQFYKDTVQRAGDGKYIIKMPLCPNYETKLGKSRNIAVSQFLQLEKRLNNNPKLSAMYKDFMKEYADLGHMKTSSQTTPIDCYLPHHGVLRENATTTKLRVVFNASQKNSNGNSLNTLLEKGPNLQKDIQGLIIKWRTYKFALIADIQMMYRCIWMAKEHQPLQKIIWRESTNEPLREYQLCTLTYGTKCAPWIAMRTLLQLANDDGHKSPAAAEVLKNAFYVDDLVCGRNTFAEAKELQQSLISLLKGGGMNLRKWSSNNPALLNDLPKEQISSGVKYEFKTDEPSKTLGLTWNPSSDTFHFNWPINENMKAITKRSLLSEISKFYDPLGWLSPVTVTAKLLFQKLWTSKLDWDDEVPKDIEKKWNKLKSELPIVKTITLHRWIGTTSKQIELCGFCDASEKAYACVVYSRIKDKNGMPKITMIAARTKVAPLTHKPSLPRLELCSSQLLAELMEKISQAFSEYNLTMTAWCDSQVALAWIQGDTSRWEVYVANRVNKIKTIIPPSHWRYVKSEQNPADCASRGMLPGRLHNFDLWWQGPEFLKKTEENLEQTRNFQTNYGCITYHCSKSYNLTDDEHIITTLLEKCSSLLRLTRIIAWIFRFNNNLRNKTKSETTYLSAHELNKANLLIINHVQQTQFTDEYKQLMKGDPILNKSSILKLNPYLDENNLIRVGGRLKNSDLPVDMKNPIIIPYNGRFTKLLIEQSHLRTLHGGARLTLTHIRQRYWIVGGNRAVKTQLRHCVRCRRYNSTENNQLMGNLPSQRVTPCRPFTHCGVDFTGAVEVKLNKGRSAKTSKGYIAIFICMVTKAVHIELVSDLSTDTFIAAFQRLCARRGTPKHMYSDCGTNFIGAAKVLRREFKEFKTIISTDFFNELAKLEVIWHTNVAGSPHAGGLWESAVKSTKHHLRRVLGDQRLTFEEFTTLLAKIEACLNSRPLCPLTEDPEEFYNCLTPGHFLTGSSILSLPLSNYSEGNIDIRRRWQLIEKMFQQYWKSWSTDYLTQLQARSKWNKPTKNINIGDIVLVKDNNLPPGKWAMGRILETHPGSDGYVRFTTIKTKNGVIKRPVVKLCPLPSNSEVEPSEIEPKTKISQSKRRERKGNKLLSNLLLTVLTLFTFLSGTYGYKDVATSGARITSMEHDRPVYYDKIGKIQMVHNEWTLLMYYNLSTYWEGTQKIDNYFENLKNLCRISKLQQCQTITEQLNHEMDLLHHYNNILLNPHKHLTANRKKRGLIDGVGHLANTLFGILDQRFADKYVEDIQSIRNNNDYLLELIKNKTTIVELENTLIKKSEENIQRQFNIIDSFINQTNQNMASLETEIEILSATTYFNSGSLTLFLLMNSLRRFQEMLFDSLTNVYQGHVDVHLVTPAHLIKQLSDISGSIPKSLSLPVENYNENVKKIYELIYIKARVTETYFLFEMHIPLISNEEFTFFQTIPLPMKMASNFGHVRLTSKYIGVNFEKNNYVLLDEQDFKSCLQQKSDKFICKKNPPVFDLHSNNAPCEAKLLSHQNTEPCDIERAECKDSWIELHAANSWLIICCYTCPLRIICGSDVTSYTMTSSGIITVPQGCLVQAKDLTIFSHSHYSSRVKMEYGLTAPDFNLNSSINKIVNLTSFQAIPHKLTFEEIDKDIAAQRKQEARLPTTSISSHDIHQYAISYTLLAAAITFSLVLVGRKRCPHCFVINRRRANNPQTTEDIELQVIQRPDETRDGIDHHTNTPTKTSLRNVTGGTPNLAFNFN